VGSTLDEAKAALIRRWGEMGGYWGISRTMAEIHALLFVSREPLCTDDIMERLHVSRGNASMNLRGLVDWGLIQRVHKLGDRKEYFVADTDVWHMFETITRERRRREVEPIIATIDRCHEMVTSDDAPQSDDADEAAETEEFRKRLTELRDFLATMGALFELVLQVGSDGAIQLAQFMGVGTATGGASSDKPKTQVNNPGAAASKPARRSATRKTTKRKAKK